MTGARPEHVSICIATCDRPAMLENLLIRLRGQRRDETFAFSVVVVDNGAQGSVRELVEKTARSLPFPVTYGVEARKNIAVVRNALLSRATGEWIAFIDDDEYPDDDWLLRLLQTSRATGRPVVLGPVVPGFDRPPPAWIVRGGFCDRPRFPTGTAIPWSGTRTGNVLIGRGALAATGVLFDPSFGHGGSDVAFFRALAGHGVLFTWCDEAVVHEILPPERTTARYLLKRAYLQGNVSARYTLNRGSGGGKAFVLAKSAAASLAYTALLPLAALLGRHRFMKVLIKDVHHASRILALLGIHVVTRRGF